MTKVFGDIRDGMGYRPRGRMSRKLIEIRMDRRNAECDRDRGASD